MQSVTWSVFRLLQVVDVEVFEKSGADAALAASLFHFKELTVEEVKEHLKECEIPVRR